MMSNTFRCFDSELGENYLDERLHAMNYEPLWQILRAGCQGQWAQLETARQVTARLEVYIIRSKDEYEKQLRTWRVFNLVNSIPRGQYTAEGIPYIATGAGDYVFAYAAQVEELHYALGTPAEWDWATTRRGLHVAYTKMPEAIDAIVTRMFTTRAFKKRRIELMHFLLLASQAKKEIYDD